MRVFKRIVVSVLVLGIVAWMTFGWWGLSATTGLLKWLGPDAPMVTAEVALSLAEPRFIDARTSEEFAVSHIKGAQRVAPDTSDADLRALHLGDGPVVVYCSIGVRSAKMAARLRKLGVDARNLEDGIFGWAKAKRPMVDATGSATTKVHPFNNTWGRLVPTPLHGTDIGG